MKNIKIIVATHKKYQMPQDDIYLPVQVGSEGKEDLGYTQDNQGENISIKNPYYCELTGLYWAWKNLDADYIGLAHYRRHFTCSKIVPEKEENRFKIIMNREQAEAILEKTDIILPKKRKYYIETVYSHYEHTMYVEPLDETEKIIAEKYPEYLLEFQKLKSVTYMHAFNMFVMKKEYMDKYCEWLFDILFELENRIDVNQYDAFHARFFGRISERLLDVWINTNKLNYEEVKVISTQPVNWIKKGMTFLQAKFTKKKYEKSF